jgi:hypothetical protein
VKSILFPYSNKIVTNYLDGELNKKFGIEFTKILEKALKIMKEQMSKGKEENKLKINAEISGKGIEQSAYFMNQSKYPFHSGLFNK